MTEHEASAARLLYDEMAARADQVIADLLALPAE